MPFALGIEHILINLLGVVIGVIFGAIPGMTATMAVATFLPITYAYSVDMALYLLLGLYVGGISGGLVPAILINIPGTPSSVCTTFDGHPMALKGESEAALKTGVVASFIGGLISLLILALFTPILAKWAIKLSAVEKCLIIMFALTVIAALSQGNMLKGIWIGMAGCLVAMMNQFSVNNAYRMVPDVLKSKMQSGFQIFPVLTGLFAISEMLEQRETGMHAKYSKSDAAEVTSKQGFKFRREFKGQTTNIVRSSLLGTLMGILPGVGGSAASIIAYSQAKSWSKHPELLGTGVPEGLIASEASNNGVTGGALVQLLSLGIPGDSTTAVLIGAFMLQGIQVGPLFITNHAYIWNTVLMAMLASNVLMFLVMFFPIKLISKIIFIPQERLYPVVLMMCTVGAYATMNGRMFDVWCLLLFGVLGYIMKKLHFPVSCFLIGFINIVAIKDSTGDMTNTLEYLRLTRGVENFSVLVGRDTLIYSGLCSGASGSIASCANVAPRLVADIFDKYEAGDRQGSLEAQTRLNPLRIACSMGTFPAVIKEGLVQQGIPVGKCLEPIDELTDEQKKKLHVVLAEMGLV